MDEAQQFADRVAVMRAGEIIASGRPDEIGGRDVARPRFGSGCPTGSRSTSFRRFRRRAPSLDGDRDPAHEAEVLPAVHELTGWAIDRDVELAHFSVVQPTLEDIYLELTGDGDHDPTTSEARRMSDDSSLDAKRDLGLVLWQVRYEQRTYSRNRGRGIFTFAFPIMFLVIFASIDKGTHISDRGGISYDDFFVPGILAYGVIATTFINMSIGTAILRDEGVLKRMQGTPLPTWAYVAARIASTFLIVIVMAVVVIGLGVLLCGLELRVGALPNLVVVLALGTAAFTSLGSGSLASSPTPRPGPSSST